jgi:hypothetical protein
MSLYVCYLKRAGIPTVAAKFFLFSLFAEMSHPHTSASKLQGQWRRKKSTVVPYFNNYFEWSDFIGGGVAYREMGGFEKDGSLIL